MFCPRGLGDWAAERAAQVKEEPAQRAGDTEQPALPPSVLRSVSFAEAFRFWLKLGFISFGGPAGQIAIMHRELVEEKRWISESRFLHALNYCM
ncbi:chromate transporter, partial [Rhodoferax sp.]|uniref:chromate transporter n=1 Tax=Rhodoferax sp. TaxID=50421 RepID=UPI003BB4A208